MTDTPVEIRKPARSQWWDVWDQFRSHTGAFWGMVVFLIIVVAVLFGPFLWHIDPTYIDIRARNQGPSLAHPMGTDQLGRDTFARMMSGGRVSLAVGMTAMLLALVLGTLIGVLAGYFKKLDGPLMRLTDLFLALPLLPLLLVIIMLFREVLSARFGPEGGIFILMVSAIGITSWMQTAATLGIATAIITESSLSFLGLGFPPDFPTWGRLLFDSVDYLQQSPARVIWPGMAISMTVLAVNYMGDGLRDALDPRIRGR